MPQPDDMTLRALTSTIERVIGDLRLGRRSAKRGNAYNNHASVIFYLADPSPEDILTVERHFTVLTNRFGWLAPNATIDRRGNAIIVTIQNSELPRRMMPI